MIGADSQLLTLKIQKILRILNDFNQLREEGRSRSDYIGELKRLFCQLFSYNDELMELFMELFSPQEVNSKI